EAPFGHLARRKAFHDNVGPERQAAYDFAAFVSPDIQYEAELSAVVRIEEGRALRVDTTSGERAHQTGRVEADGRFDPHDGCAIVGERSPDGGSCHRPCEVQHFDAIERGHGHQITP